MPDIINMELKNAGPCFKHNILLFLTTIKKTSIDSKVLGSLTFIVKEKL